MSSLIASMRYNMSDCIEKSKHLQKLIIRVDPGRGCDKSRVTIASTESEYEDGWRTVSTDQNTDWFKFVLKRTKGKYSPTVSKFVQREIAHYDDNYISLCDYFCYPHWMIM